jgi:hypothetical protein
MNLSLSKNYLKLTCIILVEQRLKDLEAKVNSKKDTHSAMVVSSPDLESLYKILAEYAKKSEFGDYTLKSDRDDILKRLSKVEKSVHKHEELNEKWEPKWGKMKDDIDYLLDEIKKKVSKEELDSAMDRIKQILGSMSPGSTAVVAAFDSSDLKDAIKKL